MKKSLLSLVAATVLLAGAGLASAQTTTTTTTTWTADQGTAMRTYSTTQKYTSYNDPAYKPSIGGVLPGPVTIYPLPSTVTVTQPDNYSYSIVNERPVVIERSSRKVIHTWD
jgi:hypothetical protein